MYKYRAKLIKCVDGDTADFLVDLGFKVFKEIRTRFLGVDTPERGQPDFYVARDAWELLLEGEKDEEGWIIIRTGKTGKYGRWLDDIENVNISMAERWPYGWSTKKKTSCLKTYSACLLIILSMSRYI